MMDETCGPFELFLGGTTAAGEWIGSRHVNRISRAKLLLWRVHYFPSHSLGNLFMDEKKMHVCYSL